MKYMLYEMKLISGQALGYIAGSSYFTHNQYFIRLSLQFEVPKL